MQAVYEQAVEQKDRVAQGRALWQLGSVLGDQGQFKNAEVPLRDALAILESELGSDHLDIAKACNGMSLACHSTPHAEEVRVHALLHAQCLVCTWSPWQPTTGHLLLGVSVMHMCAEQACMLRTWPAASG